LSSIRKTWRTRSRCPDADDDALAEGLRQGGLKNSLTQQYANATPPSSRSRERTIGEITKAGGKVEADKIVERDHLQTLARQEPVGAEPILLHGVPSILASRSSR
jgi:hypothetical protein